MLGEKMRKARESKGLSQAELARKVGISRSLYNKYERTNTQPSNEILLSLAHELDVTTDYLLGRNTPSNIEHFIRTPVKVESFTRAPVNVEAFDRKDAQKKEAPSDLFKETEEAYIKMLAEEEGTSVDDLHLSEERRRQLRRVILSLLKE